MRERTNGNLTGAFLPVAIFLVLLTIFRLWAMAHIELNSDEAYYWLWSRVPSAGYYDHPPMIAWWIWLSGNLLGPTELGVRLLPILSVLVASVAVYGITVELYDDVALAKRAAIWFNAMLLVSLEAIFATPDAPSIMLWALAVWALARLRRTGNPHLWLVIGILAGAGCVAKYTNFFLGPGILLWLLLDARAARWRFSPWVLLGGLAAVAVFLPVLVWNAEHGWMSFAKQFGRIADHHLVLSSLFQFLAGQFGLMNPVIAIFAGLSVWYFWRRTTDGSSDPFIFLIALTVPMLAYLVIHSVHDRVHPNWPGPAYPTLAIAAATAAKMGSGSIHLRRLQRWVAPVGIGLSSLVLFYFAMPLGSTFPWTSPADTVLGWRDLTAAVEEKAGQSGAAWIATTDYGLTGELAFYLRGRLQVQSIVDRQRYSFDNPDSALLDKPALLVVRTQEGHLDQYLKCFGTAGPVEALNRHAGDRVIDGYSVILVSGAAADLFSRGCQS